MSKRNLKFKIQQSELRKATAKIARVVDRRNTIPVLGYCKIEVIAGHITISATDRDIEISLTIKAETSGIGTMMVSVSMLRGIVGSMVGEITVEKTVEAIRVTDGDATVVLNDIMPPSDYPDIHSRWTKNRDKSAAKISMTQAELRRIIKLSRHCISDEETRYYLNGLYLCQKPGGKSLRAVSTDGHRMAVVDTVSKAPKGTSAIIRTKAIYIINSMIDKTWNEAVTICLHDDMMQFHNGGVLMSAKLIEGTYPDYTRLIPKESSAITAKLDFDAINRFSSFAIATDGRGRGSRELTIDTQKKQMRLDSLDGCSITVACQAKSKKGESTEIGFNYKYLMDQARITPSFRLRAASARDPAVIDSEDPGAFWLLMPMWNEYVEP